MKVKYWTLDGSWSVGYLDDEPMFKNGYKTDVYIGTDKYSDEQIWVFYSEGQWVEDRPLFPYSGVQLDEFNAEMAKRGHVYEPRFDRYTEERQ